MLKIGDFSRICQVTIKTLRYYEQLGLFHPAQVDKFTKHRYYTMSQVPHLNQILALKDMGLSLAEIKRVFDEDLSSEEIKGILRLKQAQLHAEIEVAQARLRRVEARINQLNEEVKVSEYQVSIKEVPAQRVLSIRETIASAEDIAPLFDEIGSALKAQKIKAVDSWIALYHHDGFRDTNLDIEIAIPVVDSMQYIVKLADNRQLDIRAMMPYEQVASVIENGHNEDWSGSYTALGQFMETHHYEMVGAVREVYLTTPDDEEWLVEIQFPLQVKTQVK